ncbi:hypothetical protein H0H87_010059 [Tephrocybe sp. NHM501043]|nr:hypothetical protein H0H87_010059 [Tephrocybe sp. NHM501043]
MLATDQTLILPIGTPPLYQYPEKGELHEICNSAPSSPTTSSAPTAFEDIDVQELFVDILDCIPNINAHPDLSLYEGDSLDFASMFQPIPEDDLNPRAVPFVPKKPPPKSRRLIRPDPGTMLQPRMNRWKRTFNLATRPPIDDKDIHSLIVVAAEVWEPEQLAELTQELCWRFAEATQEDLEAILIFTLRLNWQFKRMRSEEIANTFEWHLKETLLGAFISVWDANVNKEAISYSCADSQVIASGVMLSVAIGQLFMRGFLDTKDIHNCLKTLMSNFVSVEHADAVAAMFHHIGPGYWYQHPDGPGHLKEFEYAFGCIMQKLEGKMSVLNLPRTPDELSTIMTRVAKQCMELDQQMSMATRIQMQTYMQRPSPSMPVHSEDPVHFSGQVPPRFSTQASYHLFPAFSSMSSPQPSPLPSLLQGALYSSAHARESPFGSLMDPYRRANIYSLPVELLTRIFVLGAGYDYPYAETPFLLKPDQDYYAIPSSSFQLLVSHVCRHWRQVALRTPSLWNMLHLREPAHIVRAEEYISRCLPSPHLFDILVDTVAVREHIPGVTLCRDEIIQIFKIICPHVKRWRAFHLKVRDHECKAAARQHLSTCGPAPYLETLQLYHFEDYLTSQNLYLATYRPPVMVFSNDLPRLKNISLIGVNLPWEQSPYLAHLHTLELALHPENIRPSYEYWENMLRNSPDLQTLSLHYSGPRVANGDTKLVWPTNSDRIIIQSLENLSLTDLDPDYLVRIMGRLVLPGLKRLCLDLPDQDFTPFISLITNTKQHTPESNSLTPSTGCLLHPLFPSFSRLESLVITALEASPNSLRNFVRGLNELRMLEVHFASVSEAFIDVLMEVVEVEIKENATTVPSALPPKPCCKVYHSSPCPSRAASVPLSVVERIPVLPLLETLKMSGLPGKKTMELIQFRHTHTRKRHRCNKERRSTFVPGVSTWLVKWSDRWKGVDKILDRLVEHGWVAEDGTRVYLETFDSEDELDDEGDGEGDEDGELEDEAVELPISGDEEEAEVEDGDDDD